MLIAMASEAYPTGAASDRQQTPFVRHPGPPPRDNHTTDSPPELPLNLLLLNPQSCSEHYLPFQYVYLCCLS